MENKNIYGKAGKDFYKVTEHPLQGVWNYGFKDIEKVDFIEKGGANYTLNEDEIFFIKTKDENVKEYLDKINNTTACYSITKEALSKLETLYVAERKNDKIHLYVQRIMPSARIEKNFLFLLQDRAHMDEKKIIIPIHNRTDLYYNQEGQKIYFRKFSDLEIVFPVFSKYYREASKEDIESFKNEQKYPFIKVKDIDLESLPKTKLKTIAKIVDELDNMKDNFKEYKEYALKYNKNFIKDDKFEINEAKDIEYLADIVLRKFYTTEAGKEEIRIANSFKRVDLKLD